MLEAYHGSCHCGRVRFRIEADLGTIGECNCSICTKKGILHLPVPLDRFKLLCGEGELTTYRFNTGTAQHTFCRHCGIHAFYVPRSDPDQISVNARCLDDIDVAALKPSPFLTGAIGRQRSQCGRPPGHDSLPVTGGLMRSPRDDDKRRDRAVHRARKCRLNRDKSSVRLPD